MNDMDSGLIEGEDFIILSPEKNSTNVLPWQTRIVNSTGRTIRVDFRHNNLMTKVLIISLEEALNETSATEILTPDEVQTIKKRKGKKLK